MAKKTIKISLYMLAASGAFFFLALLESTTGIVSWLAPTGDHALGWFGAILIWLIIFQKIGIAGIRRAIMPRTRFHQYARRTARGNYDQ